MTVKSLLPLIAVTFLYGESVLVQARQTNRFSTRTATTEIIHRSGWALYYFDAGKPNRNTKYQKTYMGEITLEDV